MKNFSPIRQSKISFAGLTILSNFCHSRYCMHFWTYLVPRASVTKGPRTLGTIFLAYAIAVCPLVVSLRKKKPSSTGSESVTQAKFLSAFSKEFARLRKQTIHTGSFNEGKSLRSETRWRFTCKCCILKRRLHLLA